MNRLLLVFLAFCSFASPQTKKPKLVVAITVDQFRYDYLTRFRNDYSGGLHRFLTKGANFTNAHYEHFPTVTAIGHATFLSGSTPSVSGIVGNEWFDRETNKQVSSVSDINTQLLGSSKPYSGSSPRRLLVSTIGDELKMATDGKSKVVGVSIKDRSAILPVGRMADGAYWFDPSEGNFVSSTYYFAAMPGWAEKFNKSRTVEQYLGKSWLPFDAKDGAKAYRQLGKAANKEFFDSLERTPYGNDIVWMFAQAAIEGEQMGQDEITDLIAVSFSSNDRVGHALGPDAPEIRDISIQTDRAIGRIFEYLDSKLGEGNYLAVLTADHGVAPLPEVMAKRRMPGGRMPEGVVLNAAEKALVAKYGEGAWISGKSGPAPYFNYGLIRDKKLKLQEVQDAAAEAVRAIPHIYRVYTRHQLSTGGVLDDLIDRRVRNGYHHERAADLFIVADQYWLFERAGTSHGTPWNYDTHVPVLFYGAGIRAGRHHGRAAVNDIAPTLATLLEIGMPSGSTGRILSEAFLD